MYLETERLIIRDLEHKDQEQLFKIVWQKDVVRFMEGDWSENSPTWRATAITIIESTEIKADILAVFHRNRKVNEKRQERCSCRF